jgi:hypothetical protein
MSVSEDGCRSPLARPARTPTPTPAHEMREISVAAYLSLAASDAILANGDSR